MKKGTECYCFEEIPYLHVALPRNQDENKLCNVACKGVTNQMCGGESAYSVYVACKYQINGDFNWNIFNRYFFCLFAWTLEYI